MKRNADILALKNWAGADDIDVMVRMVNRKQREEEALRRFEMVEREKHLMLIGRLIFNLMITVLSIVGLISIVTSFI